MKSFNEFLITESRLERLRQHLDQHHPIAFISSQRSDVSDHENNLAYNELNRSIKLTHFGYNRIKGGYVEENGNEVEERSIVLYGKQTDENKLLNFAIALGIKFNQDSILFIDTKGNCELVSTRDDGSIGPIGSTYKLSSKFTMNSIDQFFTRIGHKKFRFKELEECTDVDSKVTVIENQNRIRFENLLEWYGKDAIVKWESRIKRTK